MSRTAAGYFEKANRALSGARLLLAARDAEGACNRAYFAMFDAAHAALLTTNPDNPEASTKTHHQLIAAFGKFLVLSAKVDAKFGRALNQVERLRRLADYIGDPVSLDNAAWAVEQAEAFVEAMHAKFMTPKHDVSRTLSHPPTTTLRTRPLSHVSTGNGINSCTKTATTMNTAA